MIWSRLYQPSNFPECGSNGACSRPRQSHHRYRWYLQASLRWVDARQLRHMLHKIRSRRLCQALLYVPWFFVFVRMEHEAAYRELLIATLECASDLIDCDLQIRFGSLDQASYIASSFKSVCPDTQLVSCSPHLERKSKEKSARLHDGR